jgi:hypothetical protein
MTTQSFIVYRNPVEQQFWESGIFVPVFTGCFVGLFVFIGVYHALTLLYRWRYGLLYRWRYGYNGRLNNDAITYTAGAIAMVSGIATIWGMI